uniref:Uncharacterized protein n=1 Tax=Acrobeloides nanus TaxID=290746 RepID=A0A914E269_9BILA
MSDISDTFLVLFLNYEVCHVKLCIADINQERSPVVSQTEAAVLEVIYRYDLYDPNDFEVYFKDLFGTFERQIA